MYNSISYYTSVGEERSVPGEMPGCKKGVAVPLEAPADGKVIKVHIAEKQSVAGGSKLVKIAY